MAVGLARLGQPTQQIVAGTLSQLAAVDFGEPLHCMVICGELHPCEVELLRHFQLPQEEGGGEGTGQITSSGESSSSGEGSGSSMAAGGSSSSTEG